MYLEVEIWNLKVQIFTCDVDLNLKYECVNLELKILNCVVTYIQVYSIRTQHGL